jgi:DNA-binding CsgD family transcriptional regulator
MLAQEILVEFYTRQLPIWNDLIETTLKKEIATWTSDPTENAERMELYHPLLLVFQCSFSKETFEARPGILNALATMDPEAYATDAAHKLENGKPFESIIQQHVAGIAAWWEALNIHRYALEAAEKEFVGSQTARIALKSKRVDLTKIENAVRKTTTASHRDPAEITSAVGLAISELLTKSSKRTPLTDGWETPPGPLGDKIREVLAHFDVPTAQAQDALTGRHRIATRRATERIRAQAQNHVMEFDHTSDNTPEPDGLTIDLERVRHSLTKKQQHILDIILTEPDASDVEISKTLNIARNSVINCKKRLRSLLSSPTTK